MVRVKTSLMILVVSFVLIACSPTLIVSIETPTPVTSPMPRLVATESAFAGPTPWVGGTQTALAAQGQVSISPTTQVTVEKPVGFTPVLYGGKQNQAPVFLLLGGVSREVWLVPEVSVARFSGAVTYSLHTMMQESKYFIWGESPEFSPACQTYSVGTDAPVEESGVVAVADGWQVTKREVAELAADGSLYEQVVIDWLRAEGVSVPQLGEIHIYRVDLEGDGTDEVFISASHLDGSQHMTKAGDYSVVLMRKVIENQAVTKLVAGDVYRSGEPELTFPRTYSLANFIDLNQDGTLEIVVDIQKWEGFGARVFQIDGDAVIQSLGAECSA